MAKGSVGLELVVSDRHVARLAVEDLTYLTARGITSIQVCCVIRLLKFD